MLNKNIALSYAMFKYANFMMPYYATAWNDTMKNLNLEIDNDNVDPTSPIGVGNLAGVPKDGYHQYRLFQPIYIGCSNQFGPMLTLSRKFNGYQSSCPTSLH